MSTKEKMQNLYFGKKILPKVLALSKLPHFEQRSLEWFEARKTCISASSIASALVQNQNSCQYYIDHYKHLPNFDFKIVEGKTCGYRGNQLDLIFDKCGIGADFKGNQFTQWGQKYEQIAANIYSQIYQIDILEFGLIIHPKYSFLGASPDGISTNGIMLEIKCPPSREVKEYPPLYYFQQILMQLECTGLKYCDYIDCNFIEFIDENSWKDYGILWENENPMAKHHIYGLFLSYNEANSNNPDELKYLYPPVSIVKIIDFLKWKESVINNNSNYLDDDDDKIMMYNTSVVYYKLNKYYISRVTSSKDWFKKNLPSMKEIWDKIEYHRTHHGLVELKQIKDSKNTREKEPKEPKEIKKKYNICLF